jgi:hypothetical protein
MLIMISVGVPQHERLCCLEMGLLLIAVMYYIRIIVRLCMICYEPETRLGCRLCMARESISSFSSL